MGHKLLANGSEPMELLSQVDSSRGRHGLLFSMPTWCAVIVIKAHQARINPEAT
jgi:hypothetical protein